MPKKFGRYELIDRISFGGMAEVYIGKSSGLEGFEKVLAIKRMLPSLTDDEDFVTMFIDEAKISAQLTHNNIGQVFEFGKCDDHYFIAMEYIQGLDLRSVHKHFYSSSKPMPLNIVLRMIRDVCNGLDYAHSKLDPSGNPMNIVHRDISPQNIIVSYDGAVKVIDFGIAKALDRATKTQGGQIKGKFSYMSPEHAEGGAVDGRADIFSLGILMFELLTNQPLFQGNTAMNTLQKVLKAEVPPIPKLNPMVDDALEAIIRKALARRPADRYQSAEEMQSALDEYVVEARHSLSNKQLSNWMKETFSEEFQKATERLSRATTPSPPPAAPPPVDAAATPIIEPAQSTPVAASVSQTSPPIQAAAEDNAPPPAAAAADPADRYGDRHTRLSNDLLSDAAPALPPAAKETGPPLPEPPPVQASAEDNAAMVADMMMATTDMDEPTVLDDDRNAELLAQVMAAKAEGEAAEPAAPAQPPVDETPGLPEDSIQPALGVAAEPVMETPPSPCQEVEQGGATVEAVVQAPVTPQEPPASQPMEAEPAQGPAEVPVVAEKETKAAKKSPALFIVLILLVGAGGGAAYWFLAGPGSGGGEGAMVEIKDNLASAPSATAEPRKGESGQAAEPAKEQPAEPAKEQPAEPAKEQPAEPAKEQPAEPAKEQPAKPAKEQPAEPAKEKPAEPAKEKVAKPVREQSAAPAKPRRARKPGYLIVVAPNQSKIFVDGKDTGRKTPVAPSNPLTLGPGRHKVRLEAGDQSTDHRVVIKSGKTAKLIVR